MKKLTQTDFRAGLKVSNTAGTKSLNILHDGADVVMITPTGSGDVILYGQTEEILFRIGGAGFASAMSIGSNTSAGYLYHTSGNINFAGNLGLAGSGQLKDILDGTDPQDAVTLSQLGTELATKRDNNMNTNRILGRTTAGVGAIQELTVGAGLKLNAGAISTTTVFGDLFLDFGNGSDTATAFAAIPGMNEDTPVQVSIKWNNSYAVSTLKDTDEIMAEQFSLVAEPSIDTLTIYAKPALGDAVGLIAVSYMVIL